MRNLRYVMLAGLLGAAFSVQAAPVTYKLDPTHTMVLFSWAHFGFSHPTADIGIADGTLVFDQQNPAKSSVEVTMPLSNLDTHVPALDKHLKEADFFDADK
jgi:polyisoprenoid-binding protein YceI